MAEAVLFSIAEGILTDLAAEALKQIRLPFGVKDELRKLRATITTIKDVLLDAEEKRANDQVKAWLDSLEDVIYDADNLIDEFRYQQLKRKVLFGKKRAKKVRIFFSSSNQLVFRLKMAKKIKQIRETLDEIKGNRQFHLDEGLEETRVVSPRETHSLVIDSEVIGRDKDRNELLGLLLDNNIDNKQNVSVVSLVGLGGLGKTTLAQVVFNDESVKKHFDDNNTFWVCVSDSFDLSSLLEKIIRSATETEPDRLNLQQLQNKVREQIKDKKYLLVLDDVWNEDEDKWEALETFLKLGAKGSRVLITTRSINVAHTVHSSKTHMLSGLDTDKSWALFERVAFEDRNYEPSEYPRLVEIGKDVVAKCKGIPLAIKTVGRLLKSKMNPLQMLDVREWKSFRDVELARVDYENKTNILSTLKLSYNNLPSHLKHCFAYCSLFPKAHRIDVQELIRLWIAQGFVESNRNNGQLEKTGYEYFMILSWGCFFQEAEMDKILGSIKYCKMHDLMHDLASLVAGKSIEILNVGVDKSDGTINGAMIEADVKNSFEKVHHVYVDFNTDSSQIPSSLFEQKKMRSFILPESKSFSSSDFDSVVSNFKFLRALSLKNLKTLPNSLGKIKHLRYLSLSGNRSIKELPNSITMLYNLQTLILSSCSELECLPPNIQNLINLRHLEIKGCEELTHMPRGIGELTSLQTLDQFIVADNKSSESAGFVELSKLKNLRGQLEIKIRGLGNKVKSESGAAQYLKDKEHLVSLSFYWSLEGVAAKEAFECLEPHQNIKAIKVEDYPGEGFPNWLSLLTNLVRLKLDYCNKCKYLPPLHRLSSLKELTLKYLSALEYVSEWDNDWNPSTSSMSSTTSFFPSLTELTIRRCPNLQGWWGRERQDFDEADEAVEPYFPKLSKLNITDCPLLTSMPLFPNLEKLKLDDSSSKPLEGPIKMKLKGDSSVAATSSAASFSSSPSALSKLKDLSIVGVDDLESLPEEIRNLSSLQNLEISLCNNLTSLPEGISNLTNLVTLKLLKCAKCINLPPLHHLSSLKELIFKELIALEYVSEWDNDWNRGDHPSTSSMSSTTSFFPSLTKLEIRECPNLQGWWARERQDFDEAVEPYFPKLSELEISDCPLLTSMPLFPNLEKLNLRLTSSKPLEGTMKSESSVAATSSAATSSTSSAALSKLKDLIIDGVDDLTSLPEGISNLKSLQNLTIWNCFNLTSLPEGISNLKSLQNLEIFRCRNLTSLPEGINNLKSLQNLEISNCNNLTSLPEGISNLKSLQNLKIHYCNNLTSLPEGISNLKSLQNLEISLCDNLTSLPKEISNLKSLQNLEISYCNNLTSLPEGISNLKSLQNLYISECNNLTSLPEGISNLKSLQNLYISECNNLTSLPEGISNLKSLQNLQIYRCNKLTSLPEGISNLKSLQNLKISGLESLPEEIRNLSSLQNLEISYCCNLTWISNLKSLQNLTIYNCNNLTSLPEGISNLKSLQNLHISDCSNLTSLPEVISNLKSLQNLEISKCNNLTSLPDWISNLKSLQNLVIRHCDNLTSLPEGISNLKSLQKLEIWGCKKLTSLPERIRSLPFLKYYDLSRNYWQI